MTATMGRDRVKPRFLSARSSYFCFMGLMVVSLMLMVFYIYFGILAKHSARERIPMSSVNGKLILMHSFPSRAELKTGNHHFKDCPESRCQMSLDPNSISQADAVVFFSRSKIARPPRYRDQVWVYFAVESPVHTYITDFEKPSWDYQFNWTMTYRYDSDIQCGYGHVHPRAEELKPPERKDYVEIAKKKTKNVAWFVSNCHPHSKREKYVEELKKHISVDIYGTCGSLSCGKDKDSECLSMLERDYRFYLSFENSLCKDYISEKLYNRMKYDVLPIVRGGADYKSIIPVKGILNVWDFPSPKALAEYLFHLAANPEEYAKYLEWKNTFYVEEPQIMPLCELCEKVHNPGKWANVYENAQKWWKKDACFEPKDV